MTSSTSVLDYTRAIISHRLERFERHARLSIDESESAGNDLSQLAATAQRSLSALALCEGYILHDSYPIVQNHLHKGAKIARGVIEVRFITGLLQDEAILPLAGRVRVLEMADLRLSRYGRRLAKLQRRLDSEGFGEQTQQLVQNMAWHADGAEPELGEFAKTSVFEAQSQVCRVADLDESNLTVVHEFSSRLQQLSFVLEMFQQVVRHDEWDSITQDVNELQRRIAPVVDYSSAKMRCTDWLEQARDADEITALRLLIALAGEQSEHYYGQLASGWNAQRASELSSKFERLLNMPTNLL